MKNEISDFFSFYHVFSSLIQLRIPIVTCLIYITFFIFTKISSLRYFDSIDSIPVVGIKSDIRTILLPISWEDAIPKEKAKAGPSAVWPSVYKF